jgi:ribosome biogenesis GTPase
MHGMDRPRRKKTSKEGEKVRVPFRRNVGPRRRMKDWREAAESDQHGHSAQTESIVAKGRLSRKRTIIVRRDQGLPEGVRRGTVIAVRGLYADVDDGERLWPCTIRRVLRTRLIKERNAVTVGDLVHFRVEERPGQPAEGAIEAVEPRQGTLQRLTGKRTHTMVANVDQAVIVSSAAQPDPKPHLIDRYIVAMSYGEIAPVICMNKIDLDHDRHAASILDRYRVIGYPTLCTSAATGEGIEKLREWLKDKASAVAGQSGVGKSSLLNAVQPGLQLKTGDIIEQTQKGRHTTTTARLLRLEFGGYVVDTPGIRTLDLSLVPKYELEAYFVEFVDRVKDCKFPDCTHTHELGCAVKQAVERGEIHPDRYATYLELFESAQR